MRLAVLWLLAATLAFGPASAARASRYTFWWQQAVWQIPPPDGPDPAFDWVGPKLTGYFDGDQTGDDVTGTVSDLRNIHVYFDGNAFNGNGNLFTSSNEYPSCPYPPGPYQCYPTGFQWISSGAVAAFQADGNNFFFSDANFPNDTRYTNYFFLAPKWSGADYISVGALGPNGSDFYFHGGDSYYTLFMNSWKLTRVPEPGTFALLGLGLLGLGITRRRAR